MEQKFQNETKLNDGIVFKKAVAVSELKNEDIISAMINFANIKKSTFYRLYKKEKFTPDEKSAAARALGKSVDEIFTPIQNNIQQTNTSESINNELANGIDLQSTQNGGSEMNRIIGIMELQARATDKDAEARLLIARALDRLSAILERRELNTEGERTELKQRHA